MFVRASRSATPLVPLYLFPHFLIPLLFFAPSGPPPLLQKGLQELQQGQWQAARADLEAASRVDTSNPYIWSALAEVYAQMHDLPLAKSAAAQAEKTGKDNPMADHALALYYSHVGQFSRAAQLEERYAESSRADRAAKSRAAAWYLAAKNEEKSVGLAKDAAHSDKQAAFELTQLFLRQQQFTDAVAIVTAGLDSYPNDPQLELALAVARYGERRFEDAITIFLKVIETDPEIEQPYLFLGRMLDQAGPHLDEIIRDAETWCKKNPTNAQAQLVLAKALLAKDPRDARAVPLLRRAIELSGGDWEAHYQLGLQLANLREYVGARDELRLATKLDPSQAMPHYHLARVYDRLGDGPAAAEERSIHSKLMGTSTAPSSNP